VYKKGGERGGDLWENIDKSRVKEKVFPKSQDRFKDTGSPRYAIYGYSPKMFKKMANEKRNKNIFVSQVP
jgi:hypothetical protein